MPVARKAAKAAKAVDDVDVQAMADADVFVNSGREKNAALKLYEGAKERLKVWLGDESVRVLPDGRTVSLTTCPRAGYVVEDGIKSTLTVMPPPAA